MTVPVWVWTVSAAAPIAVVATEIALTERPRRGSMRSISQFFASRSPGARGDLAFGQP